MQVTVKLFASLAETEGWREKRLEIGAASTALQAWTAVTHQATLPPRVLCARNMTYCEASTTLADGDEVAFFPPVTGG